MNFKNLKTMTLTQLTAKLAKLVKEDKGNSLAAGYIRNQIKRTH